MGKDGKRGPKAWYTGGGNELERISKLSDEDLLME